MPYSEAVRPLSEYAERADEGPVVVTSEGRPVAVVLAAGGVDLESISLGTNPEFLALIERSRARWTKEGGLSSDEVRRRLRMRAARTRGMRGKERK